MICSCAGDLSRLPDVSVELVVNTIEGLHFFSASASVVFFMLLMFEKVFMVLNLTIDEDSS